MNEQLRIALPVLLPAMGAAALFWLAAWRPWRHLRRGEWGGPLAFGAAFIAGFLVLEQSRGLQLKDRWHWILPMIAAAMVVGLVASLWRPAWWGRMMLACALAGIVAWLFHPLPNVEQVWLWRAALAAITLVSWINLEALAERRRGASLPLALWIVFVGLSLVLLEMHQAKFSLLAAAMAAAAGAGLVVALLCRQFSLSSGAMHVVATAASALLVIGWMYNQSEVGIVPLGLIIISPAALWIGELPVFDRLKPWLAALLRAACAAVPIALAVGLAMRAAANSGDV